VWSFRRRRDPENLTRYQYHDLTGGLMSQPTVTFPDVSPNSTGTQCAAGSRRDADGSNALPCEVCGHRTCGFGKQGPLPCETCRLTADLRAVYDTLGGGGVVGALLLRVARLEAELATLNTRVTAATDFPI
jgi:hypothetical protein